MARTKLADRRLPNYTRGEEIFNMVTHIVGGGFGVIALALCVTVSLLRGNGWGLAGGIVYGVMTIFLYTVSSVYHGLKPERAKKVMQVLDHCMIYAMIVGTYAPILLTGLREKKPLLAVVLGIVILVMTAVGVTFTAIDFHRYKVLATGGYFVLGWSALFSIRSIAQTFGNGLVFWLVTGGVVYTISMIFFALGIKRRWHHSVFHIFIVLGSILQFVGIFKYCF